MMWPYNVVKVPQYTGYIKVSLLLQLVDHIRPLHYQHIVKSSDAQVIKPPYAHSLQTHIQAPYIHVGCKQTHILKRQSFERWTLYILYKVVSISPLWIFLNMSFVFPDQHALTVQNTIEWHRSAGVFGKQFGNWSHVEECSSRSMLWNSGLRSLVWAHWFSRSVTLSTTDKSVCIQDHSLNWQRRQW